jgi:hypothetical protein
MSYPKGRTKSEGWISGSQGGKHEDEVLLEYFSM